MEFDFFKVRRLSQVQEEFKKFKRLEVEEVFPAEALGRFLAEDIFSPEDLPPFFRATMDGYAVRARDTFGARENEPVILKVKGEIRMGEAPAFTLRPGEAARIATGGVLPTGADAVVMVEHTEENDGLVEIKRPVAPQENVLTPGEDYAKGSLVFPQGKRITPPVVGVLAGLGVTKVKVGKHPRVGIISTGDELVPPDKTPPPGKIRDINSYTLLSATKEAGARPKLYGLIPDQEEALEEALKKALSENEVVLISGGSSVGTRDFTLSAIQNLPEAELICHGLAVRPGKPTIFARVGEKAVFGLPGQVASALLIFYVLVRPFLLYLQGACGEELSLKKILARAKRNIPSAPGREDFLRVRLIPTPEGLLAEPIFKKSGLISSMAEADGFLRIPENVEGIYEEEWVEVLLLP